MHFAEALGSSEIDCPSIPRKQSMLKKHFRMKKGRCDPEKLAASAINRFETLFLLKSSKESYFNNKFIRSITSSLKIPVILSTGVSSFYLKEKFNEHFLTIVETESRHLFLQRLLEDLQHLRQCKTIFVLKNPLRNYEELKSVFKFCWHNRMVNVIAVFQDFGTSSTYYSYSNFGNFKIEEFIWRKDNLGIFPDRMLNLHGVQFPILFGGSEPGVIISGNSKFGGYLGHIISTLAKKHNARLDITNVNSSISPEKIYELVLKGIIEISGGKMMHSQAPIEWFSYPITVYDWGVMVPVEPKIPTYKVFTLIFHWEASVILIVIFLLLSLTLAASGKVSGSTSTFMLNNIVCFRGMLGQSFSQTSKASVSTKIIYTLLFLLGIMMVTSYDGFLQSLMTQPPREKVIKSFAELEPAGLKISVLESEIDILFNLRPCVMEKYSSSFHAEIDYTTLKKFRDTFNTKHAFAVSNQLWKSAIMFLEKTKTTAAARWSTIGDDYDDNVAA
ncbi:uncharacterized protein LOC129918157 [Episyrphus balteatus]|uniref:uncharacterized protein LOC129918157 n=1 Tax=Episyrphus balteatus TaxID=286459 RepID=UPI0024858905|nr:uncharacterized protein LOC129918157 [Episyrphus balteatus]